MFKYFSKQSFILLLFALNTLGSLIWIFGFHTLRLSLLSGSGLILLFLFLKKKSPFSISFIKFWMVIMFIIGLQNVQTGYIPILIVDISSLGIICSAYLMKNITMAKHNINAIYLPEVFEDVDIDNDKVVNRFNNFLEDRFSFGVDFLYEMERFKPSPIYKEKFVKAHIVGLFSSITNNSTFVSLTCDHFAFILGSYINLFKGGENCFVQPIGFPLNAQIILKMPFEQLSYRRVSYGKDKLQEYIDSLSLKP